MNYSRGAEWRRWDLHIHTPYSELNNGFGNDFNAYAKEVLRKAVDNGIAAIGLTDYFSIEGYKRFRHYLSDRRKVEADLGFDVARKALSILLLPNIELRASIIVNDNRVNFHVLFSDEVSPDDIEEHFLRELKFTAEASPDQPDEKRSLTVKNLEDLGRTLQDQHEKFKKYTPLFAGMMNAVVSHEDVTEIVKQQNSRFGGKVLFCTPSDEDLSKCSWDGQGHLARKLLIQKSHFLFSSNAKTRQFGLGHFHPSPASFVAEFKTLKPCVHGSDAHDFKSLFMPSDGRNTWIKADPTFDGLKQVLNEPEGRVQIGSVPRILDRIVAHPTKVMSQVEIGRTAGSAPKEKWFNCRIPLNPEMIAIIGNKGSGKSALSDILGLLGNTPRHASFSFLNQSKFRDPKNDKAQEFEASLLWADGREDRSETLGNNPLPSAVEKVKYIPQSYLELICNEISLGKGSKFYDELENVIFSHVSEAEQAGFETLSALLDHLTAETNNDIKNHIRRLDDVVSEIVGVEDRLSGQHRASLLSSLEERKRELASLPEPKPLPKPEASEAAKAAAKGVTDALEERRKELNALNGDIDVLKAREALLAKRQILITKLQNRLRTLKSGIEAAIAEITFDVRELGIDLDAVVSATVQTDPVDRLSEAVKAERILNGERLASDGATSLPAQVKAKQSQVDELQLQLGAADREYQSFLEAKTTFEAERTKIVGTPEAVGTVSYIESQIREIKETLPKQLRRLERERDRACLAIFREKGRIREAYRKYYGSVQNHLAGHPLAKAESFKLSFSVTNKENEFAEGFLAKIHRGRIGPFMGEDEGGTELRRRLAATDFNDARSTLRFARGIVRSMKSHSGRDLEIQDQLRQGASVDGLYRFVFALDYLSPIYSLLWEDKGLEQLSPGERGNLLLIFYLLVDKSDIALVIDQPEENLDNQTVYRILVPCIKDAKQRRQIVIVTHNPNLAVVCDAEQIICASMDKSDGNAVDYFSGSIENSEVNKRLVDILEGTRPAFDKRDDKYIPA